MARKTKPVAVQVVEPFRPRNAKFQKRLIDFDTGSATLEEQHKRWLREAVTAAMKNSSYHVRLTGFASRVGDLDANQRLSQARLNAVLEFMKTADPTVVQRVQEWRPLGEKASGGGENDNSPDWRAVEVYVFIGDPPPDPPDVVPAQTRTFEVTAKSFIALVGSKTGRMPGVAVVPPVPLPPPAPPVPPFPVPVKRQLLLEQLAKATDAAFNENPRLDVKDKKYRLFSRCKLKVVFEGRKILSLTPSALETDTGKEGPLQAPPLTTTPVTVGPTGGSSVTFTWQGKSRPHLAAEPSFQLVKPRTSVFIWHVVNGVVDVSGGTPVLRVSIAGSRFPSHRAYVDGVIRAEVMQGEFANLWVPDPADRTRVR